MYNIISSIFIALSITLLAYVEHVDQKRLIQLEKQVQQLQLSKVDGWGNDPKGH